MTRTFQNLWPRSKSFHQSFCEPKASFSLTVLKSGAYQERPNSAGPDGISNIALKLCEPVLTKRLTYHFNRGITLGDYPSIFKLAKVVALRKDGRIDGANNYKSIPLLNCMSNIFEGLIYVGLGTTRFLQIHWLNFATGQIV